MPGGTEKKNGDPASIATQKNGSNTMHLVSCARKSGIHVASIQTS